MLKGCVRVGVQGPQGAGATTPRIPRWLNEPLACCTGETSGSHPESRPPGSVANTPALTPWPLTLCLPPAVTATSRLGCLSGSRLGPKIGFTGCRVGPGHPPLFTAPAENCSAPVPTARHHSGPAPSATASDQRPGLLLSHERSKRRTLFPLSIPQSP